MERSVSDSRPFCQQILSEGVIAMDTGARIPSESDFKYRFRLHESVMDYFADPDVVKGERGTFFLESAVGTLVTYQHLGDQVLETDRQYSPKVTEMLAQEKRARQRADNYRAREKDHQGFVGSVSKTSEDLLTRIRTGRTITLDQAGNVVKINGLASRYAYPFNR